MKACKDCVYCCRQPYWSHRSTFGGMGCARMPNVEFDAWLGREIVASYNSIQFARRASEYCGEDGKGFERRPTYRERLKKFLGL